MRAEKHVRRFNRLNGNGISKERLVAFHAAVKRDLDEKKIDAHMPFGIECVDIEKFLAKAIQKMGDYTHVDELQIKRIPLNRYKIPASKKQTTDNLGRLDVYGLECVPGKSGLAYTATGQKKIYDMVTDMVLKAMQKKDLPWRNAWDNFKIPLAQSYPAKRKYSGVNLFLLNMFALQGMGYSSPYFLTFKQVNTQKGKIRKKAQGWPVVFYTMMFIDKDGKKMSEEQYDALPKEQRAGIKIYPIIQYYKVFNAQDVEGIEFPKFDQAIQERPEPERIEAAEQIVANMPNRPDIDHGNRTAHYLPSADKIDMPARKAFKDEHRYYSVLFHELIHSTGHKSRVKRDMSGDHDSKEYAFEELVAELGATYLCAESGILYHTVNDSAAYVKHYSVKLKAIMKDDNKFFLKAAAAAQKAADYILGRSGPDKESKPIEPAKKLIKVKPRKPKKRIEPVANEIEKKKATEAPQPNQQQTDKSGVAGLPKAKETTVPPKSLSGVNYQYTAVDLGIFSKDFHRMFSDTVVQIWGMPGHGKTFKLLQLVKHFAKKKRVLYVAREEHGRSVFAEKLFELGIEDANGRPIDPNSNNMRFRKYLTPEDMEWAETIFADSATALDLTPAKVEELMEQYPNRNWWLILQSIKSGNFAGSQKWEHLVDVAGEVHNRKIILRKNRLDKDNAKKAQQLKIADEIIDKKQQFEIKEAVKKATKKANDPKPVEA